jgi:ATP-dependent helicase/nuclease subunit A
MTAIAIPDARQREVALDPARSFIVQAPAGSGKTELLIEGIHLQVLRHVDDAEDSAGEDA